MASWVGCSDWVDLLLLLTGSLALSSWRLVLLLCSLCSLQSTLMFWLLLALLEGLLLAELRSPLLTWYVRKLLPGLRKLMLLRLLSLLPGRLVSLFPSSLLDALAFPDQILDL